MVSHSLNPIRSKREICFFPLQVIALLIISVIAADEAKNRSGYGTAGSRSSSPSSSGQSTTDTIKEKTSEFAQQAKSAV